MKELIELAYDLGSAVASFSDAKYVAETQRKLQALKNRADVKVAEVVLAELQRATSMYGPMHSPHEGFAILKEEVDELWDEVKRKPLERSNERMREEAIQIAAMAMRFAIDVCGG